MEILKNFKTCKIGDKLQVRENLRNYINDFPHSLDNGGIMEGFENKVVTIANMNIKSSKPCIRIFEDKGCFLWDANMFYNPIQYGKYWE